MISQVVDPPERLREEAQALAEKIAKNSPMAMAATKRALWGALETGLTDACRVGAGHLVSMWGHPDQEEGTTRVRREARGSVARLPTRARLSRSIVGLMTPPAQRTCRRPHLRLGAVLLIAAVASIVIAAPPASGKTNPDPCALLTRAEIKQVYGGPVAKPTTDASGGCDWEVRGGSFEPRGRLVSTTIERDVDTTFEQARASAANSGGFLFVGDLGKDRRSGSNPCLGDCPGAIFYASPAGTIQILWVRAADAAFSVSVKLPKPPAGVVETPEALPLNRDDPLASELARLERLAKRANRRV